MPRGMSWINLNEALELSSYQESFAKWVTHLRKNVDRKPKQTFQDKSAVSIQSRQQITKARLFDQYLLTVKPVIHQYIPLCQLPEQNYGFFTDSLNEDQVSKILQIYKGLSKFSIRALDTQIVVNGSQIVKDLSSVISIDFKPIYRIELQSLPQNEQIKYWSRTTPVKKFTLKGKIVHGKGIAEKELGMPTANIDFVDSIDLSDYPPGVYVTKVFLPEKDTFYLGATSLGTNPHYENEKTKRILETYILNDFGAEKLYGMNLEVEFHELIRFEYKFRDFDSFLNAMGNDIEVTKGFSHLLPEQHPQQKL